MLRGFAHLVALGLVSMMLLCKIAKPVGRPRSTFNDVALQDCQARGITRPYRDAQDRLLWKDKTCPART